jgi:hypothetical protein
MALCATLVLVAALLATPAAGAMWMPARRLNQVRCG